MKKNFALGGVFLAAAALMVYMVAGVYDLSPTPLDLKVQEAVFSWRSEGLNALMIFITHLADTWFIIGFCAVLVLMPNRGKYGIPVTGVALGGVVIYKPMKHIFARLRPEKMFHLVEQGGYSFPSGHSVTSVIVYGLLIYLLEKHCEDKRLRRALQGICFFLAVAIGPSRIYVGVHWPTDVVTGWFIGLAVLTIAIGVLDRSEEKKLFL